VLVEGATSKAGEEEEPPSLCGLIEANANIVSASERNVVRESSPLPYPSQLGGRLLLLYTKGRRFTVVPLDFRCSAAAWRIVLVIRWPSW
jgi:hypothetical protein